MEATPAVDLARTAPPTGGGRRILFDLIASRIPPGQVMNTLDRCQGVQGVVWRCQKTFKIQVPRHQNRGLEASWGVL